MGREGVANLADGRASRSSPFLPEAEKKKGKKGEDVSWSEELSWLLADNLSCRNAERESTAAAKISTP